MARLHGDIRARQGSWPYDLSAHLEIFALVDQVFPLSRFELIECLALFLAYAMRGLPCFDLVFILRGQFLNVLGLSDVDRTLLTVPCDLHADVPVDGGNSGFADIDHLRVLFLNQQVLFLHVPVEADERVVHEDADSDREGLVHVQVWLVGPTFES